MYCFTQVEIPGLESPLGVADFDGDGHLDVLTAGFEIWFGDGGGAFPNHVEVGILPSTPATVGYVDIAELDGQTGPDILLAGGGQITVLHNDGTGMSFGTSSTSTIEAVDLLDVVRVIVLDIDDDGVMDALGTSSESTDPALQPLLNDGSGNFASVPPSLSVDDLGACLITDSVRFPEAGSIPAGLATLVGSCSVDVPLSGSAILLVRSFDGQTVDYGEGPFTGSAPRALASGDIGGDGLPDLLLWNEGDETFSFYHGTARGTFVDSTSIAAIELCPNCPCLTCGFAGEPKLFSGDFDGDGRADLLFSDEVTWVGMDLVGRTRGVWLESIPALVADFNEDGSDDIFTIEGAILVSKP